MDGDRAGAGRPLRSQAADDVLHTVRRRLRRHYLASAALAAAWLSTVAAAVGVLLHVLVRPIEPVAIVVAVAVTWLVAMVQACVRPVSEIECASWADRHLGGESAYETYVEHRGAGAAAPAMQRLVGWIDGAARRSVERLASMPGEVQVAKPLAVATIALLLAAVLLQVPMQTTASLARGTSAAAASASLPSDRERRDSGAAQGTDPLAADAGTNTVAIERRETKSDAGAGTPAPVDTPAADSEARDVPPGVNAALGGEQAGAGGRDAGKTADMLADTGLTEAWQGEMAVKLRELATTDEQPPGADPALAADYRPASAPPDAVAVPSAFEPAAAVAPVARLRMRLGPAEQAYVRSYLADSGATP